MVPPIIPVKQATLQSPDGKMKTIVDVGSGDAASLQSKGWTLGAPPTAAVVPVANALTQSGNMAPTGVSPAPAVNPTQQAAAPAPQAPTAPAPAAQPSPQAPMQQPAVQPMPPAVPPATPTTVPTAQPQQATLQSPDGQSKVVVTVGSGEAAQLQSQGWTLGAPANASVETAQQALNPAPANTQPNANTQQDLTQQDITQQDQGQNLDFSSSASDSYSSDPITHELLSKYGITPPAASGNPVQDYADTYNHLITSMGLMDIKSQFNEVQKKYSALQNELNDKISSVNDDPWLSEGMRVAQIKSVQDKYQGKLQILDDQQKLYDSLYQQGVQQAQYVANAAFQQQQFNTQTAFNTAELALKEQESKAALKSANLRDQLSVAQDMRQAAEDKSKNNQDVVDNARASLALIANTFGENVFSQMSAAEKRKWEQSTGMPTGTLDHKPTGLQPTIAQRVDGWQNGYVFDSSGNPVADVSKATADDVANAIMTVESKGNFNLTGGSGEKGAFQFMPATWNIISQQYAKATGINMSLPQTPDNEDKVARWKIGQLLDAGNTPEQVAMIWNGSLGGSEKPIIKSGINQKSGVKFDTQKYANSVINVLRQNISGTGIGGDALGGNVISGVTGKPLTDAERSAQGYANRMAASDSIINDIGSQFADTATGLKQKFSPNFLQSPDYQSYQQAQRDFVNSVLRRESGAAISQSEFDNAALQYFPQPGDSAQVIAQKAANRVNATNSVRLAGGITHAYSGPQSSNTAPGTTSSGLSYAVIP